MIEISKNKDDGYTTEGKVNLTLEIAIGAIIYISQYPVKDLNSLYFTEIDLIEHKSKIRINVERKCAPRAGNRTKKQVSDHEGH